MRKPMRPRSPSRGWRNNRKRNRDATSYSPSTTLEFSSPCTRGPRARQLKCAFWTRYDSYVRAPCGYRTYAGRTTRRTGPHAAARLHPKTRAGTWPSAKAPYWSSGRAGFPRKNLRHHSPGRAAMARDRPPDDEPHDRLPQTLACGAVWIGGGSPKRSSGRCSHPRGGFDRASSPKGSSGRCSHPRGGFDRAGSPKGSSRPCSRPREGLDRASSPSRSS